MAAFAKLTSVVHKRRWNLIVFVFPFEAITEATYTGARQKLTANGIRLRKQRSAHCSKQPKQRCGKPILRNGSMDPHVRTCMRWFWMTSRMIPYLQSPPPAKHNTRAGSTAAAFGKESLGFGVRLCAADVSVKTTQKPKRGDLADKPVEVAPPPLRAKVLLEGERHALDRVAVPDGLEHGVGEAHDEQVLRHLLAQVVVDTVHVRLVEVFGEVPCELYHDWKKASKGAQRVGQLCKHWAPTSHISETRRRLSWYKVHKAHKHRKNIQPTARPVHPLTLRAES